MSKYFLKNLFFSSIFALCSATLLWGLTGGELTLTARAASGRPQLMKGRIYLYEREEEGDTLYLQGFHDSLKLTPESAAAFPALDQALEAYRISEEKEVKKLAADYVDQRKDHPENVYNEEVSFVIEDQVRVRRADEDVLSFLYHNYTYAGGVHGGYGIKSGNYDVKTGKEISLDNIIKDQDGLAKALKTELEEKYDKDSFFEGLAETLVKEIKGEDDLELTWALGPQGVTFCFSPYEIGPYAAGSQFVTLTYTSYGDLFTDAYRPGEATDYGMEFSSMEELDVDLDQDGQTDRLSVSTDYDEDGDVIINYTVRVNDRVLDTKDTQADVYYYSMDQQLLIGENGKVYLYINGLSDNDYSSIDIYDLSGGKPVYVASRNLSKGSYLVEEEDYSYCSAVLTDSSRMLLSARFDILSTYSGRKVFYLGKDGEPESSDPYYMIESQIQLKSKAEITADRVDEKGNVISKDVKIPAGSSFDLYRTDGKKLVDAMLEDGSLVRLSVEGTFPAKIDGTDAEDLFEELFYAG